MTNGHGSEIAMMILKHVAGTAPGNGTATTASSQGGTSSDEPLHETYWKLIELDGKPVTAAEQQREAHLIFRSQDSRISGSGGCNRLMGGYVVEGSSMHFRGVGSTMMACLHGMEAEQAFVGALNKVESWKITGKHLELFGAGDVQLMKFEATALR
jgi:heat shock protein HslJ